MLSRSIDVVLAGAAAERQAVRLLGNVVVRLLLAVLSGANLNARPASLRRAGAGCATLLRALVVLAARRAGVVRAPVVRTAGCVQPDFMPAVVRIDAQGKRI